MGLVWEKEGSRVVRFRRMGPEWVSFGRTMDLEWVRFGRRMV